MPSPRLLTSCASSQAALGESPDVQHPLVSRVANSWSGIQWRDCSVAACAAKNCPAAELLTCLLPLPALVPQACCSSSVGLEFSQLPEWSSSLPEQFSPFIVIYLLWIFELSANFISINLILHIKIIEEN